MNDGFKSKMVGAIAWSTVDRIGQQIVQLVFGIVLARLLMPSEFGLIGVLMIFVSLSSVLVDGGFGQALIRKQNATGIDYNTVFYTNLLISVLLYIILFFSAPLIANFFSQPKLTVISRVLFISIIFNGLNIIQYTLIIKKLKYQSYAFINIASFLISGSIATIMAFKGFGVWSLVAQQLGFHVVRLFIFPVFVKWKPTFSFSFSILQEIWSFSIRLLGTNILNVIFNQLYMVLIGRFFSFQQVGYYYQANKLSETINGTTQQVIQNATFPLFSKISGDDSRILRIYRQLTQSISMIVFPLSAFVIAVAYPLITILLSSKWIPSVEYFQLLVMANFFTPQYLLNISLLNSRGESKRTFNLELLKKAMILISIFICFRLGIKALIIGYICSSMAAYLLSMIQIKKSLNHPFRTQIPDIAYFIFFGIVIGVVVNLVNYSPLTNPAKLSIQAVLALVLFLIAAFSIFKHQFNKIRELFIVQGKD